MISTEGGQWSWLLWLPHTGPMSHIAHPSAQESRDKLKAQEPLACGCFSSLVPGEKPVPQTTSFCPSGHSIGTVSAAQQVLACLGILVRREQSFRRNRKMVKARTEGLPQCPTKETTCFSNTTFLIGHLVGWGPAELKKGDVCTGGKMQPSAAPGEMLFCM